MICLCGANGGSPVSDHPTIPEMTAEVHKYLADHGWFDQPVSFLESMMLLVTEATEAVEAWRQWGLADATPEFSTFGDVFAGVPPKPEGVGSELADILIRLIDSAQRFGVDLDAEYRRKMDYNHTRPYRHNKRI